MTQSKTPCFFFFNDTATTEIYTLSLHDALPIYALRACGTVNVRCVAGDAAHIHRSEEHTSELQSRGLISYAVFCLTKQKKVAAQSCLRSKAQDCSHTVLAYLA